MGGYGMTPNVVTQLSSKLTISTRYIVIGGSLSSSEQQLWFPNQIVQDPDPWTLSHLIQLKQECEKLVEDFNCDNQEFITVQDLPSFNTPHKPSFDYYTQYVATSAGRTAKGSTIVSTNFISSTHEGLATLTNKH